MIWGNSGVRTLHAVVIATVLVATLAATVGLAHAAPPTNDDFDDAETISGSPVEVTGTLVDATTETGGPRDDPDQRTVWYAWTAPTDDRVDAKLTEGWARLDIYTGDSLTSLEKLSGRYFDAVAGATYYVLVSSVDPAPFSFVIRRSASISGTVVDASGVGIAGVRVDSCRTLEGCGGPVATTDSEGHYQIQDVRLGTHQVHFEPDGVHVDEWFGDSLDRETATDVVVEAEDRVTGIDAELAVGRTISGRVTGPGGDPAGTSVWACRWSHEHNRCISDGSNSGRIAADGTYTVDSLPPGDFKVRFWSADVYINEWYDDIPELYDQDRERVRAAVVSVPADDDVTGIDAQLVRYSSLSGRVVNRIGEGQDAWVNAYRLDAEGKRIHARTVRADEDGRYVLERMESADYKIEFELTRATRWYDNAADGDSATVVPLPESTDLKGLDLELEPTRSISGVVTDADGNPVEGAMVSACDFDSRPCSVVSQFDDTNANGAYLITPPAGTYAVHVRPESSYLNRWYDDAITWETATSVTVDDESRHVIADMQVTTPSTISGTVTDSSGAGLEGVRVKACREPVAGSDGSCSQSGYATTDSSGDYTVRDIAQGRYSVEFRSDGAHLSEAYDNHLIDWVADVDYVPRKWIGVGPREDLVGIDAELFTREEWEATAYPAPAYQCNGKVPTIVGEPGQDVLVGTPGPDVIHGASFGAEIRGRGGDDIICAGEKSAATIRGGRGNDVLIAGDYGSVLIGGPGADVLKGRSGDDRLVGNGGRDTLKGRGGDDVLVGGRGRDTLKGHGGRDTLKGKGGHDLLVGGGGRDRLKGNGGRDTLKGKRGHDVLIGGGGRDRLKGNGGRDTLKGKRGHDVLLGGRGWDKCRGGPGRDRSRSCEFRRGLP